MYQVMDEGFVGLIFSCFNDDTNSVRICLFHIDHCLNYISHCNGVNGLNPGVTIECDGPGG